VIKYLNKNSHIKFMRQLMVLKAKEDELTNEILEGLDLLKTESDVVILKSV